MVELKELNQELRKILNDGLRSFGVNPDTILPISWEETQKTLKELKSYYKMEV